MKLNSEGYLSCLFFLFFLHENQIPPFNRFLYVSRITLDGTSYIDKHASCNLALNFDTSIREISKAVSRICR